MQEEHLSPAIQLILYYGLYFLFIEEDYFGLDGDAVRRRSGYDAQIAGTEQRELQGTRDGGSREREGVHLRAQLAQLFLRGHAELLLFVHYQQAEVLEFKTLA